LEEEEEAKEVVKGWVEVDVGEPERSRRVRRWYPMKTL